MKKLNLFSKLFLSIFLVATLAVLSLGVLVYLNQKEALINRTTEQLKSVNILKKTMVQQRLEDDEKFMWHFIKEIVLKDNDQKFSASKEFKKHKSFLLNFCKDYGHVDVMLLDENEQAIDSLFEGNSYAKKGTFFTFTRVFLIDNSKFKIALVTNPSYLQHLMFENTGMGNSGESYLVAEDKKMITKSRFFPNIIPNEITVNTPSVNAAIQGQTGTSLIKDYRNIEVLSAYSPIMYKGLRWVLLSEIDLSEAMQPVQKLRNILLFFTLFVIIAAFGCALYISKIIAQPIKEVSKSMEILSQGAVPSKMPPPFHENEESAMKVALNRLIDSFDTISHFAKEIGRGNINAQFEPLGEKDELGKSLLHMREQLKLYQEREKHLRRQKTLSLIEGQENERKRIARDLHDGLGQWLTGLKLKIAVVHLPEHERNELKTLVSETIEETRRITNNLMPNSLIDFGLEAGLRQLVSNIQKGSALQIDYTYIRRDALSSISFDVVLTLYRIAQEGLNNILKHADAKMAKLRVEESNRMIFLEIEDDGVGIQENHKSGNGLGNMEERAKLVNGTFTIEKKEKGTALSVVVPLNSKKVV